jgi:phage gp36-like protein
MPYATPAQLLERLDGTYLAQLADDTGQADATSVVDAKGDLLAAIIEDADRMMDSYIAAKYIVPVDPPTRVLTRCSVAIAIYDLHMRRDWTVTPEMKTRYDDMVAWLRDVAAGKAKIDSATELATAATSDRATFTAETREYTRTSLGGFI